MRFPQFFYGFVLALGLSSAVLIVAAAVAVRKVRSLVALPTTLFQSSIAELREDADALRREPGP